MICTRTPRASACPSASMKRAPGAKYEAESRMERAAAVMEVRYMSCMLSAPPPGELMNTCPRAAARDD